MTSTDWSRAVRLSSVQFLACWTVLDLGAPPLALELRSVGRTLVERDRIYRAALEELTGRGLADPHPGPPRNARGPSVPALRGAPPPSAPLAGALRLLARAPVLGDLRLAALSAPERPAGQPRAGELVALGAMAGEYGVVAVHTDAELVLLPVSASRVPAVLVELVGPLNPARARPVNVPAELLDRARRAAAGGGLWALADRLVELGVLPADASSLARMCTGLTAGGQLGVTLREPSGRERRGRWVVGFHRAEVGDCLQLRRPTDPAREIVTIAPVTAQRLLAQFAELLGDDDPAGGPPAPFGAQIA